MGIKHLVGPMFEKTGYQKSSLYYILQKLPECIKDALEKEGTVQLNGIGTFSLKRRNARTARNPKTGESMEVPERTIVHFKMHKSLRHNFSEFSDGL